MAEHGVLQLAANAVGGPKTDPKQRGKSAAVEDITILIWDITAKVQKSTFARRGTLNSDVYYYTKANSSEIR
jgi:hypothetical protein